MIVLGIETSCDETGCALVDRDFRVLGQCLHRQAVHSRFGGVVPEIAARAHLEKTGPVVRAALEEAGLPATAVDAVAYTRGPGLLGPLLVGSSFAQGLGRALGKPCLGLNHLEGHIASVYLAEPGLNPPFLALLASGGHTELVRVSDGLRFEVLGRTRDDAAGEAFDKCGKILGLGYPAGPELAALAASGDRDFMRFPRALMEPGSLEFSFSGLKTSVAREVERRGAGEVERRRGDFCAAVESAIVDVLVAKALWALEASGESVLAAVGGVAANVHLRERLSAVARRDGFRLVLPETRFCGDNGAMMAAAAQKRLQAGIRPASGPARPDLRWGHGQD